VSIPPGFSHIIRDSCGPGLDRFPSDSDGMAVLPGSHGRNAGFRGLFCYVGDSTETCVRFGPLDPISHALQNRCHNTLFAVFGAPSSDAQGHDAIDVFLDLVNQSDNLFPCDPPGL